MINLTSLVEVHLTIYSMISQGTPRAANCQFLLEYCLIDHFLTSSKTGDPEGMSSLNDLLDKINGWGRLGPWRARSGRWLKSAAARRRLAEAFGGLAREARRRLGEFLQEKAQWPLLRQRKHFTRSRHSKALWSLARQLKHLPFVFEKPWRAERLWVFKLGRRKGGLCHCCWVWRHPSRRHQWRLLTTCQSTSPSFVWHVGSHPCRSRC